VGRPGLTDPVLEWGGPRLRDLPWRRTRDPWAVLVSEVMLQQTQVSRVVPKWHAFLDAFPDPPACAAAPLGDVLRLWHGLGYPRRARNLHIAAMRITEAGSFPDTLVGLLALPGVGPYTARAVLAFAYEVDVAVVDTNIARVLARVEGRRLSPREVQQLADAAVPPGEGWVWNQTLMDLGATICRPGIPDCPACPVVTTCAWARTGPDPSIGSAGVSTPQSRFVGSDRQARGALMRALTAGPVPLDGVAGVMRRAPDVAARLLGALCSEGLVTVDGQEVGLPEGSA